MELLDVPLDGNWGIEEDREDGLSRASIVHYLSGKEQFLVVVKKGVSLLDAFGPLEEEDEAVDVGSNAGQQVVILQTVHFFHLNSGSADLLDQLCEDARVGLNSAPLIKHFYI
jgi:hypothetical protein